MPNGTAARGRPWLGMDDHVYALAVSGTTLYAGGYFTKRAGNRQQHCQMERQRLVGLGLGDGGPCQCAGGEREHSLRWGILQHGGRGVGHQHCRWNGSAWSALGTGWTTKSGSGGERERSLRRRRLHQGWRVRANRLPNGTAARGPLGHGMGTPSWRWRCAGPLSTLGESSPRRAG